MRPIPELGKTYKFYDDGKVRESRQYNALVIRLATIEEAKKIMFPVYLDDVCEPTTFTRDESDKIGVKSLYDCWIDAIETHTQDDSCFCTMIVEDVNGNYKACKFGEPWLYAKTTDWFVECKIPDYEKENTVWFVRTIHGGWFSMDIHNCWESGLLDVDNHLTEALNKQIKEYGE